ncbi:hypothetical protein COCCADRAFT_35710 [Bipolaris zeicola 26-R-13]|uniref:Cytochrome P450 monooxygenase n=1 Tax=Cochliobolus carbonum (strain 26-R-13) TaxID=930089 RepID=W6Y9P6_COCC2|nr:uncharacterized protein COCCADRAFT_35710 [Bipolaris zeicola 26-R-13]EUC34673.1 hypothetical protein COCCADRAFT_35710 [Bipolaris zeicola 26-R-13]
MDPKTAVGVPQFLQMTGVAVFIFAAYAIWPVIQRKWYLAKFPSMNEYGTGEKYRQTYLSSAREIYEKGYTKFKNSCYALMNEQGIPTVVIPASLLPELRKLPEDVLSRREAISQLMEIDHTRMDPGSPTPTNSVKADLTPALARLNPTICNEVDDGLTELMPPCKDWTEVKIFDTLTLLIAKVSGRVFVGPEVCQDPEYIDTAANYTLEFMNAVHSVKALRPWLKPYLGPRTLEVKKLRQREKLAEKILRPLIEDRIQRKANDPSWKEPDDLVQWMLNRRNEQESVKDLVQYQLTMIFAAIHTTTATATSILYTLAVTPQYIEPLREEIRSVLPADGAITFRALQQMEKLDSYIKEVMRVSPAFLTSFVRYAKQGFTLSTGAYIPAGVYIEAPAFSIYNDAQFYASPENFDGFRSYRIRRGSGKAQDIARNQSVTSNETNLNFGYGRHACPGRFFAVNEIKMVMARVLLQYDVKMPGGKMDMYSPVEWGTHSNPDASKTLLLRKVEV